MNGSAPTTRPRCKRLVVSTNFYESFQLPTAELVDAPIERVEPTGVRTNDGVLHELDVLTLATGFKVDSFMRPMEITGVDGLALDDVWAERPTAYMSVAVPGFPNFFMLNGPNSPVGNFSLVKTAEMQFDYVLQLIDRVRPGERSGSARQKRRRRPSMPNGSKRPRRPCGRPDVAVGISTTAAFRSPGRSPFLASPRRWRHPTPRRISRCEASGHQHNRSPEGGGAP